MVDAVLVLHVIFAQQSNIKICYVVFLSAQAWFQHTLANVADNVAVGELLAVLLSVFVAGTFIVLSRSR